MQEKKLRVDEGLRNDFKKIIKNGKYNITNFEKRANGRIKNCHNWVHDSFFTSTRFLMREKNIMKYVQEMIEETTRMKEIFEEMKKDINNKTDTKKSVKSLEK